MTTERSPLASHPWIADLLLWCVSYAVAVYLVTSCAAGVVTIPFLDDIAWRESRNNPRAVGKAGELGAYQIRAVAVQEINKRLGWHCSHRQAAITHGRAYAQALCVLNEIELRKRLGRQPIQAEVYHAYQLGLSGAIRTMAAQRFHQQPPAGGPGSISKDLPKATSTGVDSRAGHFLRGPGR